MFDFDDSHQGESCSCSCRAVRDLKVLIVVVDKVGLGFLFPRRVGPPPRVMIEILNACRRVIRINPHLL